MAARHFSACGPGEGGGYSLYSDDKDDRLFFRGCNRRFNIFLGVVQAKSNWYLLGYKNRSFEYASLINSALLVFSRLIFDQEVYFRVRTF